MTTASRFTLGSRVIFLSFLKPLWSRPTQRIYYRSASFCLKQSIIHMKGRRRQPTLYHCLRETGTPRNGSQLNSYETIWQNIIRHAKKKGGGHPPLLRSLRRQWRCWLLVNSRSLSKCQPGCCLVMSLKLSGGPLQKSHLSLLPASHRS